MHSSIVDVRPERFPNLISARTNPADAAKCVRLFVAGIPGTRPKTRASVTGRTWAYQTKSAFSDGALITSRLIARNGWWIGLARVLSSGGCLLRLRRERSRTSSPVQKLCLLGVAALHPVRKVEERPVQHRAIVIGAGSQ